MKTYRLLQISDCHIAEPNERVRDVDTTQRLNDVLAHTSKAHPKHAAVLLTGDISQTGSEASYQVVNNCFEGYPKPVYALAGNHDNLLNMREQTRQNLHCVHSAKVGNWQILLLDSTVTGEVHGHIKPTDLDWLNHWLSRSTDTPTIVALHHPPESVHNEWMDAVCTDNGETLMDTLKQHPHVRAVVFGHVHHSLDEQHEHIRILSCPSTAFKFEPEHNEFSVDTTAPPSYRWLDLHENGDIDTGISTLKSP